MDAMVAERIPAVISPTSFRTFLQEELARRCARNRHYSLRAFAKFLRIDHSTLSQLLRGRRPFSERTIGTLGARLGMGSDVIARFVAAAARHEPSATDEWIPYAILELMTLDEFRPDCRRIATTIGISLDQTVVGLDHLIRHGLLEMSAPGRWTRLRGHAGVAVDRAVLPRVLQAIARFRAELASLATESADAPHAYRLEIDLSPVTTP